MAFQTDAFYHLSLLFLFSMMVFPLKRRSLVALVLVVPVLTEIVQFLMPGRVPDFMDAFYGYLGILLAFCLVQMWRELAPVTRKIADFGLRRGTGHGAWGMGKDRGLRAEGKTALRQAQDRLAADSGQPAEKRRQITEDRRQKA